ncbi:MAG TPA: rod shape-determining protein MreD, partial [Chloroflexota bacterium]|nr:rod shape-determining protein MreD [Chloroflexota bacterium]
SVGATAPQLVLLSVVAWSLARGPIEGMFWGFAGGLLFDLASAGPVGVSALAMLAVAAVAGSFGGRIFGSNPLLPLVSVFVATVVYFDIDSFLLASLHYHIDWGSMFVDVALPTAIANALLSLIVYPLFVFVARHTSRQLRVEF